MVYNGVKVTLVGIYGPSEFDTEFQTYLTRSPQMLSEVSQFRTKFPVFFSFASIDIFK